MRLFNSHTSPRYVFERGTATINPQVRRNILSKLASRSELRSFAVTKLPMTSKERSDRNAWLLVGWTVAMIMVGVLIGWLLTHP